MTERPRSVLRESAREMVVVVLSILIAFSLDAWRDSTIERRQEQELLSSLLTEFRSNEEQLALRINNHQRLAANAGALADALAGSGATEATVPDSLLLSLFVSPTFDPTLGTLEEAQNSGRTGLIQNRELRALLGAWPGLLRDAREEERLAQELVQNDLYTVLAGTVYVADLMQDSGGWVTGGQASEMPGSQRSVPTTPALANFSRQRWLRNNLAALELSGLLTHLGAIVLLLEAEVAN